MSDRQMTSIPCAECGEPVIVTETLKEKLPDDGDAYCDEHTDWPEELTHSDDE